MHDVILRNEPAAWAIASGTGITSCTLRYLARRLMHDTYATRDTYDTYVTSDTYNTYDTSGTYDPCDTGREPLRGIAGILRDIAMAQPEGDSDRAHFKAYSPSSTDFETVYIVKDPAYNTYMEVQQAINQARFERFEDAGIDFARPTQTVQLARVQKTAAAQS